MTPAHKLSPDIRLVVFPLSVVVSVNPTARMMGLPRFPAFPLFQVDFSRPLGRE